MAAPILTTAVIGAGPAGLLFAVVGRLLAARTGEADRWALGLYDKRAHYERTHRLRLDPAPYLDIQRDLDDPRFDQFVDTLRDGEFSVEVSEIEAQLLALATELGIRREVLGVGTGPGEVTLPGLRHRLEQEQRLVAGGAYTVVAADSIHSVVREWVRGDSRPVRQTHERLARLRIVGSDLLPRLGAAGQYRLAKVLGSVLDYRLNRHGYAELDLFLTPREHDIVRGLGATPRDPVALSPQVLGRLRAPLFRAVVDHVERGPGGERRQVFLQSTFLLEHAVMPRLAFAVPEIDGHVFLVGDAAISLPFQRGMACAARCAHSLARIHRDLLVRDAATDRSSIIARYDVEADAVKRREIAVVRARAQLVRTLREIIRISALLPFPIQSWWLRAPHRERLTDRLSVWFFLNLAFALGAVGLAFFPGSGAVAWLALPVEAVGGVVYHSALAFEGGPHRLVRRIWEIQIAAAFLAGVGLTVWSWASAGRFTAGVVAAWWLLLAGAFVLGLYLFERTVSRWFLRAGFRFADPAE